MNNKAVDRYCKKVGKLLICSAETRRELLDGLRDELTELPPEKSDSVKKLEIHYGKIPETAINLQDVVSPDERAEALARQRKTKFTVSVAVAAILIILAALICFLGIDQPETTVISPPYEDTN